MAGVAERLAEVRSRIAAAGRDPDSVRIVAMVKTFGVETVSEAVAAGVLDIGENDAGHLERKRIELGRDDVRWHFAGNIQRNKVGSVAPMVWLWHSVDRVEEGRSIAKHRPGAKVLVQVNVSGEPQKGGCDPRDAAKLVDDIRATGLDVRGLMAIAPLGPSEAARPAFRRLAEIGGDLGLPELSMGMSGDFDVALQEGATIVRLGTVLFGPRHERRRLGN